jgi:GIY-YIG catalytic domain
MESQGSGQLTREVIRAAFEQTHTGYSSDRVIADPELNAAFVAKCESLAKGSSAAECNHALMNLRKAGLLGVRTTARTYFPDEDYRFASEIAIRLLERRDGTTLDQILCEPSKASEFDALAEGISPGFGSLRYRWAALRLRKQRALRPEIASRLLNPSDAQLLRLDGLQVDELPAKPGVYAFIDAGSHQTLYVGEASNLRRRLQKHLEHSDNKELARRFWSQGVAHVLVEVYVLPDDVSVRERRAIEQEQITRRRPLFNIKGRP